MVLVMKQASIAELKARLSEFIAIARRGEEVVVTDRGRPVARLAPLTGVTGADSRMAELIRTGAVRPPERKLPRDFARSGRVPDSGGSVLAALLAERENTR